MEFDEEFAVVQGALISVQHRVGNLHLMSSKNGK
jgi:hypothetical protein